MNPGKLYRNTVAAFAAVSMGLASSGAQAEPPQPSKGISAAALNKAASQTSDPVSVLCNIFNSGARGVVLGELHMDLSSPLWLAGTFRQLKEQCGVSSLYLEAPVDFHPVIERIGKGDQEALARLNRAMIETTPGGLQVRTRVIQSALEAGLRVIPLEMQLSKQVELRQKDTELYKQRLIWSDPEMQRNFEAHDDGGRYMAFVGMAHTYPSNLQIDPKTVRGVDFDARVSTRQDLEQELSCPDWQKFLLLPHAQEGGIDRRLGAVSVDVGNCPSQQDDNPPAIRRSRGLGADFILTTPSHPLQDIGFPGKDYQGWRNLLAEDAQALSPSSYSGPPGAVPSAQTALALFDLRDKLKPGVSAEAIIAGINPVLEQAEQLQPSNTLDLLRIYKIKRHLTQMAKASLYARKHGPFEDRLPIYQDSAVPLQGKRLPPTEEQLEGERIRLADQLDSMCQRGMCPKSAAVAARPATPAPQ